MEAIGVEARGGGCSGDERKRQGWSREGVEAGGGGFGVFLLFPLIVFYYYFLFFLIIL